MWFVAPGAFRDVLLFCLFCVFVFRLAWCVLAACLVFPKQLRRGAAGATRRARRGRRGEKND